jgi:hypothetical protein
MAIDIPQNATLRLIAELIDKDRATFGPDEQAWWAEHSVEPLKADVVRPYNDRRSHDIYVLARCSEYALVFHDGHEIFSVVPLLDGKCPAEGNPFDTIRDAVRWFLHARRAESVGDSLSNARSVAMPQAPPTIRCDGLYFGLERFLSETSEDYEYYYNTLRIVDGGTVLAGLQVDTIDPNTDAPEIARWLLKDGPGTYSGRFLLEAGFITIDIDYPRGAVRYVGTVSEDRLYLESRHLNDSDNLKWPILFRFVPV